MAGEFGRPTQGGWGQPQRLLERVTTGSAVVGVLLTVLAAALVVGTSVGLVGAGAIVVGLAGVYLIGWWQLGKAQERLYEEAFPWRDVGEKADPVKDFGVKYWSGRPREEPPTFVTRTAMKAVEEALDDKRFVLLTGERTSGKSRLIFEIARSRTQQISLISTPAAADPRDPLVDVLDERFGLATWEGHQILFIRDFAKRLIARRITAESMQTWLELHGQVSIVATLNPAEDDKIKADGEEAESSLKELEELAEVIPLDDELDDSEFAQARVHFPDLEDDQLRQLPRYMVAEHPLRERFSGPDDERQLAREMVRAVADWQRIGLARPAPKRFLSLVASNRQYVTESDLDAALGWATEPVRGKASLLYALSPEDGESVFEADRVVIDLLDADGADGEISQPTWDAVFEDIVRISADPERDETVAAELITLGEAAMARGKKEFGREILEGAKSLGNLAQEQRSARALARGARIGSVTRLLVDSRRGDSILKRIRTAQSRSAERQALALDSGDADRPNRAIAAIYRRRVLRAFLRGAALMLADVFSVTLGLAVGMVTRALLSGDWDVDGLLDVLLRSLAPWGAATIFVFALLTLYKQDAPRARLDAILLATGILGVIGLATAAATDFNAGAAIGAAAAGTLAAAFVDYRLRVAYDTKSCAWVRDHGLSARTLLLGGPEEAAAVEAALPEGITRPTKVCGYLTPDAGDPSESEDPATVPKKPWLGSLEDFAEVVAAHDIGRVVIANPQMPPDKRQALANRCHLREIPVEAVPSPSDIQAGAAQFVAGQSLVLMPLVPLWRGHTAFVAKRALDFGVALAALILLSPVMALIALSILVVDRKTPLTVRAWRPGGGRDAFAMYRFRTSKEERKPSLKKGSYGGNDDRPTDLGAWLRKRGLDELPQLLNILRGDMSLVGPRPLRLADDAKLHDAELLRYVVRPGATGPWQVSGRSKISLSELTALDMAYLRHWTIISDLEILVKTARLVIRGREKPLSISMESRAVAEPMVDPDPDTPTQPLVPPPLPSGD